MTHGGSLETFFRCPRCRFPHEIGTKICPFTKVLIETAPTLAWAPKAEPAKEAPHVKETEADTSPGGAKGAGDLTEPRQGLHPGQVLDGRYQVGAVIGQGAMGTVFEGRHILLGRAVAIKSSLIPHRERPEAYDRFLAEGRVVASVAHPNVVQTYDLGIADGTPYLVMERLHGQTLEDRLADHGPLPLEDSVVVARQILAGLGAVHARGIVHRDLKPANVFLVSSNDAAPHARILDFGVSTEAIPPDASGRIIGTPSYLAPEQAMGEPVDARTDIWAVGVCLYEMLTGKPPFRGDTFNELMMAIGSEAPSPPSAYRKAAAPLDDIVLKALAKRGEDRYQDAKAMLEALRAPLEKSRARERAPEIEVRAEPPRELCLIAEPDPHFSEVLAGIARELGFETVTVGDAGEAREMLDALGSPRLLLVNLSLPREDGFSLLRSLAVGKPDAHRTAVAFAAAPALRLAAHTRLDELGIRAALDPHLSRERLRAVVARALRGDPTSQIIEPAPPSTSAPLTQRARLDRISEMKLVDEKVPDARLQNLVAETAKALEVPVALVSLVLEDRQWFKGHYGIGGKLLEDRGTPVEWAFCQHVVDSGAPLIVTDAKSHPVFAKNPLVEDGTVGSYAGAPLVTPTGEVLGTLCIIDHEARSIPRDKVEDLVVLARRVAGELELEAEAARNPPPAPGKGAPKGPNTNQRLMAVLSNLDTALLLLGPDRRVMFANQTLADLAGVLVESLIGLSRESATRCLAPAFADASDYLRRVRAPPEGPFAAREDFIAQTSRKTIRWSAKPIEMSDGVGELESYTELAG